MLLRTEAFSRTTPTVRDSALSDAGSEALSFDHVRPDGERSGVRRLFVSIRCGATRRWFVVVLLAAATLAAPAIGSAKPQKTIVVSISEQMLWAYKGDRVVRNT